MLPTRRTGLQTSHAATGSNRRRRLRSEFPKRTPNLVHIVGHSEKSQPGGRVGPGKFDCHVNLTQNAPAVEVARPVLGWRHPAWRIMPEGAPPSHLLGQRKAQSPPAPPARVSPRNRPVVARRITNGESPAMELRAIPVHTITHAPRRTFGGDPCCRGGIVGRTTAGNSGEPQASSRFRPICRMPI